MERKLSKRKMLHRKYKRYAAAIAGAAIMAGSALPGVSVAKTFAAESPTAPPISIEQTTMVDKNEQQPVDPKLRWQKKGWHEHDNSWPSSDDNQGLVVNGQIYYRNNGHRYNDHDYTHFLNSPVAFVRDAATTYGFDPDLDSFTLLFHVRNEATVQIIKHDTGQRFKINLERNHDHDWAIITIRGIGDSVFPATYRSIAKL